MPHGDGTNGSGADSAYLKNTPIEINETEVPVRFLRYGLLPDSGGPGRWRGGLASVLEFQVFAPDTRITVRNRDRCRFRPWGTLGGEAAEPSNFILNPGTPKEKVLGNADILVAEPGDVIHIHSPGGGGRGSPLEREPERVLARCAARLCVGEGGVQPIRGHLVRRCARYGSDRGHACRGRSAPERPRPFSLRSGAGRVRGDLESSELCLLNGLAGAPACALALFCQDQDFWGDAGGGGKKRQARFPACAAFGLLGLPPGSTVPANTAAKRTSRALMVLDGAT